MARLVLYANWESCFREVPKVKVSKQDAVQVGEDTLVVPMPSAFGLVSPNKGFAHDLLVYKFFLAAFSILGFVL